MLLLCSNCHCWGLGYYSRVTVIGYILSIGVVGRKWKAFQRATGTHLAPLKRVTNESNVVTHNPIRPGTFSCGINTDAAEP